MLHRSRDVDFREGERYTAPNAADEVILNEHFNRDVIEQPKPIEKQPTKRQTEESLDDNWPPKPLTMSPELADLQTSHGEAWKPPAEGSRRNRAGKLVESVKLVLKDKEFEDIIPIYVTAVISDDHEDGIDDPRS